MSEQSVIQWYVSFASGGLYSGPYYSEETADDDSDAAARLGHLVYVWSRPNPAMVVRVYDADGGARTSYHRLELDAEDAITTALCEGLSVGMMPRRVTVERDGSVTIDRELGS